MSKFRSFSSSMGSSSNNSPSVARSLSMGSHRVKRHLVNSALLSARQSLGSQTVDLSTHVGTTHDHVKSDLGKELYRKLRDDSGLTLVKINYCARALQEGDSEYGIGRAQVEEAIGESYVSEGEVERAKEVMGFLNHDYLVLELQHGPDTSIALEMQRKSLNPGSIFILAEKLGGHGQVGIHINVLKTKEDVNFRLHDRVKLWAFDCGKSKIPLKTILKILGDTVSADYNLKDQNCWDYATAATKKLLMECVQVNDGINLKEKQRLQKEHDNLEARLNTENLINTVRLVCNFVD